MPANHPPAGPAGPGPGVDAQGLPVIDPTANVTATVEAAVTRMDDLLALHMKRQDDLRTAEHTRVLGLSELRAYYELLLREAEAKRIDAIRAVDQGQITRAAEVASTQAGTLANQVAASAEAMRNQVAQTATAAQLALGTALEPIQKDIADLRRAQYEQQGRQGNIVEARDDKQWTTGAILSSIVAFIAFNAFLISAAGLLFVMLTRK